MDSAHATWAKKKEPSTGQFESRLLKKEASSLSWFSDEAGTEKRGTLKLDSVLGVEQTGTKVQLETCTKKHDFEFDTEASAKEWADQVKAEI